MDNFNKLEELCKLVRYDILTATTRAGSGHPTSSLSAVELATTLFFGGFFRQDLENPREWYNDRFVLSKGHASPLLYSLYQVAGALTRDELLKLRTFDSLLEGHPTPKFKYVDVATGSLGQGLSVGIGMALGIRLHRKNVILGSGATPESGKEDSGQDGLPDGTRQARMTTLSKVFVLLGDSEFSEGQIYEALQLASYYKLNNLVGILDVNRLGQRGETMLGWDLETYQKRISAFGWETIVLEDGHNLEEIYKAYNVILGRSEATTPESGKEDSGPSFAPPELRKGRQARMTDRPTMIIAKTVKGKGVSFLENQEGWHGKALSKEQLDKALEELGNVDLNQRGELAKPTVIASTSTPLSVNSAKQSEPNSHSRLDRESADPRFREDDRASSTTPRNDKVEISTREAYGEAIKLVGQTDPNLVILDAEVSNSTFAETFAKEFPNRYFEMFIAEQNMISVAVGLATLGFTPFASTFAAFLSRAFDQIRMAQYSQANIKLVGSHSGVSIGQDGPSQMGLEDLAIMRSVLESKVFYPTDAVSTIKLTRLASEEKGMFYIRTTREKTPIIYSEAEEFQIGGSKVLHQSDQDIVTVFSAGITLHEALKAYEQLKKDGISISVVDLYSIKPIDSETVNQMSQKTKKVIVVEDHYPAGGLGEAVLKTIADYELRITNFVHLAVSKLPRSGKSEELLAYEEIDAGTIVKKVKELIS